MAQVLSRPPSFRRMLFWRSHIFHQRLLKSATISEGDDNHLTKFKPYESIPSKNMPFVPRSWGLIRSGGPGYLHEHCDKLHKELGPIFREQLGNHELVFVADTRMIQTVISNEGKHPQHNVPEAWLLYNEVKDIERGLFFQVGEPWAKIRHSLNKVMLSDTKSTTRFSRDVLKISEEFLDNWIEKPVCNIAGNILVEDIKTELCKWSIETTGFMLFGNRMGVIPESGSSSIQNEKQAESLVRSLGNMFRETSNFQLIPCRLAQKFNLPVWRRFEKASDDMLKIANHYSNKFITLVRENDNSEIISKPSIVRDLLNLNQLTDDEISRSMVDLVIAAADTTSSSLQWILYIIAKHRDVHTRLAEEVEPLLRQSDTIDWNNLRQLAPYLDATINEAMRLYPTAPFLARTLDRDIVLDGYRIPAKKPIVFSLYTTSRMTKYFEDALEFRPERWLRNREVKRNTPGLGIENSISAYATLPFGVGTRMCIGRRAAKLEMSMLIAAFVSKYDSFLPEDMHDIKIKLKMILGPDKPINLIVKSK